MLFLLLINSNWEETGRSEFQTHLHAVHLSKCRVGAVHLTHNSEEACTNGFKILRFIVALPISNP